MTIAEFLTELRGANVKIWLDQGQIRCKAPKGVLTAELAARITEHKPALVEFLESLRATDNDIPRPTTSDRSGDLPLSFAQERLWFLNQLEPDSSAYNMTAARRFHVPVDPKLLQRALDELARRHEILRSTFPRRAGRAVQVIGPLLPVPLMIQDLRSEDAEAREQALHGIARDESHQLFDLEQGPLFRARLVQLQDSESVLYLSVPHIISDGWSMGVLITQLTVAYVALAKGHTEIAKDIPIQYGDFVLWQRGWLRGQRLEKLLAFWQDQIRGAPLVLPFLAQKQRSSQSEFRGDVETFALSPELSNSIRKISKALHVTEFVTLLSVYGLVLARYSGSESVLVGTPVANRNWLEFESMVGLFVNTIALHANCVGSQTVAEFLTRNHQMLLDAYAHQDLPFEKLVEAVNPDRSSGFSPIFQATFVYQNTPGSGEYTMISGGSMFDLSCYLRDTGDEIEGAIEYNTAVLDKGTVCQLLESFQAIANALVADQQQRLSELPVLSVRQQQLLLNDWNNTSADYPRDESLASLFVRQAIATPDACALVAGNVSLSYRDLNEKSNRLANYLIGLDVGPGQRVAVCLERSLDQVIGILAILKAGCAYVPLDPDYPLERLKFMLEDVEAPVVLTSSALANQLPASRARIVRVDQLDLGDGSAQDPARQSKATDLAYIMYTSGSTGTPKGVAVMQRNVARLVRNTNYANFDSAQVFLLLATVSFDASTLELWGPLLNGGRLVIAPPGPLSATELGRLVREHGVTTLWLTAGLFHQMVDAGLEDFGSVRQLLAGGDVLSPDHVKRALEALEDCVLINGYGPTENTTFSCCHRMSAPEDVRNPVPIGRPIANTKAYVLDGAGRLSPPGAVGELYLGGDGVALGYWRRPELTAERFVADPITGDPDARFYRTGDQVRWLPDGVLEFMGRRDFQLKIRGFRVEPGEVEASLRSQAGVREAVVLGREDNPGDKRLVAYVVAESGDRVSAEQLRAALRSSLPEYMLPSAFVMLDHLPLTSNGKVDRRALPAPERGSTELGHSRKLPVTALEVQIAAIWEQVLGVEGISVTDNFFDIGGTSLVAVKLFKQLSRAIGRDLPLATLFQAPTVGSLATVLQNKGWSAPWKSLVGIHPLGDKPPLFLVPGVGGNVLCFAPLAKLLGENQPVYGLQSRGLDGHEPPRNRIEDMASAYIREVRSIQSTGPYYLGGACSGGAVAFEMAQQLLAMGEKVATVILIETWSPRSLQLKRRKLRTWLHPVMFLFQGIWRHLAALLRMRPDKWYGYLRSKFGIVRDMIEQKDVYRGDRSILYQDAVSSANYEAMSVYVPTLYPGKLHLFIAAERPVEPEQDSRFDWTTIAAGGYSVDHINALDSGRLLQDPHVQTLARKLRQVLESAAADQG